MAPSATDDAIIASKMPPAREYPPAKIFPMKEAKFEKSVEIQSDGREKALARDDAVIVIDNGQLASRIPYAPALTVADLCRLLHGSRRMVL